MVDGSGRRETIEANFQGPALKLAAIVRERFRMSSMRFRLFYEGGACTR